MHYANTGDYAAAAAAAAHWTYVAAMQPSAFDHHRRPLLRVKPLQVAEHRPAPPPPPSHYHSLQTYPPPPYPPPYHNVHNYLFVFFFFDAIVFFFFLFGNRLRVVGPPTHPLVGEDIFCVGECFVFKATNLFHTYSFFYFLIQIHKTFFSFIKCFSVLHN